MGIHVVKYPGGAVSAEARTDGMIEIGLLAAGGPINHFAVMEPATFDRFCRNGLAMLGDLRFNERLRAGRTAETTAAPGSAPCAAAASSP
jgi:hypothetical protein